MNRVCGLLVLCGFIRAAASSVPDHLDWSDEFNSPTALVAPDPAKWSFETGAGGWGNDEEEFYCAFGSNDSPCRADRPNAYQDGHGHLVIRAFRNDGKWTSARLISKGKAQFRYGRIEARLKLPKGVGEWPAFWLLNSRIDAVPWPASGEIDVMENVPLLGRHTTASTLHGPVSRGTGISRHFRLPHGTVDGGFHVYGMSWTPDAIAFYVDEPGRPFFVARKSELPAGDWVYDDAFFLLLNLAIGGRWPGPSSSHTPNPSVYLVDYVRVYGSLPGG